MYKLFFNDERFEQFAVRDLIDRGVSTIQAIRNEPDLDLDELKAANMDTLVKSGKVSDPKCLSFLTEQLISMGKMSTKTDSQTLLSLYEIFLSLAVLFGTDLKA